jgi:DNA-binding MarR family transcriptional regulator
VLGNDAEELAQNLTEIQRILRGYISDFLRQRGISEAQAGIIRHIGQRDGLTVSELSRFLGQSKGYVSVLLDQMQTEGLVCKVPCQTDQRLVRLHLTKAAIAMRENLMDDYRHFLASLLERLSTDEIRVINAGLQQVRVALDKGQKDE